MDNKLEDCECLRYADKVKIVGSLYREITRLERDSRTLEKAGLHNRFKEEIIPEYNDLIERIKSTPDCAQKLK